MSPRAFLTALLLVAAFPLFTSAGLYVFSHPHPATWVKQIKIDRPNPRGDFQFVCKSDDCTNLDEYIGLQSHFVYKGWENIARGKYDGKFIVTGHLK